MNKNTISTGQPKEIARLEFPKVKGGRANVIVHSTPAYGMTYACRMGSHIKITTLVLF
ncbi:MAG: hypothetical protein LKM34_07435 [Prevotella sp.]|nr:hypothetical protein [Prevotella sp.]